MRNIKKDVILNAYIYFWCIYWFTIDGSLIAAPIALIYAALNVLDIHSSLQSDYLKNA